MCLDKTPHWNHHQWTSWEVPKGLAGTHSNCKLPSSFAFFSKSLCMRKWGRWKRPAGLPGLAWDYSDFGPPSTTWDGSGQHSKGTIWEAGAQISWALSTTLCLQQEKQEKAFTISIRLHDKCHLAAFHGPFKASVCFPGQQPLFLQGNMLDLYDRSWFPVTHHPPSFWLPVDRATVLLGPVSAFIASKEGITADWLFPQTAS